MTGSDFRLLLVEFTITKVTILSGLPSGKSILMSGWLKVKRDLEMDISRESVFLARNPETE